MISCAQLQGQDHNMLDSIEPKTDSFLPNLIPYSNLVLTESLNLNTLVTTRRYLYPFGTDTLEDRMQTHRAIYHMMRL